MRILDATCGPKGIWFQKNHPFVTFMDERKGKYYYASENSTKKCWNIQPDVVSKWEDAPFPDNHFDMIVFDPPHIIQKPDGYMTVEYGKLNPDNWNVVLRNGIKKLFNILKPKGIFILKWCECSKPIEEVLKLFPYKPMFGTRTGINNKNIWIVFIKHNLNKKLDIKLKEK